MTGARAAVATWRGRFGLPAVWSVLPVGPVSQGSKAVWSGAMGEQALQAIDGVEGLVKWFDPRKGFGFIVGPEGQDIFTHYTVIQGDGFRVLKDGASVQ